MAKKLGKIEKPPVAEYRTGRKLFFTPLIFTPSEPQADFKKLINSYWSQVEAQVSKLEAMLNNVDKVYHELITVGGEEGMKVIEELNSGSYQIATTRLKKGAPSKPTDALSYTLESCNSPKRARSDSRAKAMCRSRSTLLPTLTKTLAIKTAALAR